MTDEEFETFLSSAQEELRNKQDSLVEQYGFGTRNRWWFDQTTEKLQLFDEADNLVIEGGRHGDRILLSKIKHVEMGLGQHFGTAWTS